MSNTAITTIKHMHWTEIEYLTGWMTCDFTSFLTVLVRSGRREDDNERLCVTNPFTVEINFASNMP